MRRETKAKLTLKIQPLVIIMSLNSLYQCLRLAMFHSQFIGTLNEHFSTYSQVHYPLICSLAKIVESYEFFTVNSESNWEK